MTDLRAALERYLSLRQRLGHKYQQQARRLTDFVAFMETRTATTITTKLAVEWATLPPGRHASWALRLTDVRGFARHVANIGPATEVPPAGLLPRLQRAKPYIYSDTEIGALLAAALALPPTDGLRRWTYYCPVHRACEALRAKVATAANVAGDQLELVGEVARRFPDGVEGEGSLVGMADDPSYKNYSQNTYGASFAEVAVDAAPDARRVCGRAHHQPQDRPLSADRRHDLGRRLSPARGGAGPCV